MPSLFLRVSMATGVRVRRAQSNQSQSSKGCDGTGREATKNEGQMDHHHHHQQQQQQQQQNRSKSETRASISALRSFVAQHTSTEWKCRTFCGGRECRYCNPAKFQRNDGVGRQVHALFYGQWIGDTNIVAMARPVQAFFPADSLAKTLVELNVRTVINLQEPGEHNSCGPPLLDDAFSYQPELLMRNGVFYYNFPLSDYGSCGTPLHLLDVVKVLDFGLEKGSAVAIHCHAGHGRTGMLIAAWLIYRRSMQTGEAIEYVRTYRGSSCVQSASQVEALNSLFDLIEVHGISARCRRKSLTMTAIFDQQKWLLNRKSDRAHRRVPRILLSLCERLASIRFGKIALDVKSATIASNPLMPGFLGKSSSLGRFEDEIPDADLPVTSTTLVRLLGALNMEQADSEIVHLRIDASLQPLNAVNVDVLSRFDSPERPNDGLELCLVRFLGSLKAPGNAMEMDEFLRANRVRDDEAMKENCVVITTPWTWSLVCLSRALLAGGAGKSATSLRLAAHLLATVFCSDVVDEALMMSIMHYLGALDACALPS